LAHPFLGARVVDFHHITISLLVFYATLYTVSDEKNDGSGRQSENEKEESGAFGLAFCRAM
jgi:hypothetical protein